MSRGILINERGFDDEHVTAVDDSGNAVEYTAGLEAGDADETAVVGNMRPAAQGTPDAAVDADVFVRTDGDVGSARWGWSEHSAGIWRGKMAAHVVQDLRVVATGALSSSDRVHRPKARPLRNGALLLFYLKATNPATTGAVSYRKFVPGAGWQSEAAITLADSTKFTSLIGACAVQFEDTQDIVLIVMGYDGSSNVVMERFHADGRVAAATSLSFKSTGVRYTVGPSLPISFAIEVLPRGRVAMLVRTRGLTGSNLYRSYSVDRGVTWAAFEAASTFAQGDAAATIAQTGGVSICRQPNGALIAMVGVDPSDDAALSGNPEPFGDRRPAILPLVSEDGDTWRGLLTLTTSASDSTPFRSNGTGYDWPLGPDGCAEAAVAVCDDGIPRVFGCYHGDTDAHAKYVYAGTTSGHAIRDDWCLLSLTRQVTLGDAPPAVPLNTTGTGVGGDGAPFVTASDAFYGTTIDPNTGMLGVTSNDGVSLLRSAILYGAGTNNLDSNSATYKGPRTIDAVLYRGAVWVFTGHEDTANTVTAITVHRANAWTSMNERPPTFLASFSSGSEAVGAIYSSGWVAWQTPSGAGLTKSGTGTEALEGLSGQSAAKLTCASTTPTTFVLTGGADGTNNAPYFIRFKVKNVTGAGVSADDIAVKVQLINTAGTAMSRVSIRVSSTQVRIVDEEAASTIDTLTGTYTDGVEVIVAWSDHDSLYRFAARQISNADPEDEDWQSSSAAVGFGLATTGTSPANRVEFGTFSNNAVTSAWFSVQCAKGELTTSYYALDEFTGTKAFDAATPDLADISRDSIGYDDGLRHGSRAPIAAASPQYLQSGLFLTWKGAGAISSDRWRVRSGNSFAPAQASLVPVRSYWRSSGDGSNVNLLWDAGANAPGFAPSVVALFGINFYTFSWQMNDTNSWGTPSVNLLVDSASATRRREEVKLAAGTFAVERNGYVARLTDGSTLVPHRYRARGNLKWYVWSDYSSASFLVADNDETRIFFTDPIAADADDNFMALYPNRIAIYMGTMPAAGYRYARLHITAQTTSGSEDHFQVGYVVAGQRYPLDDPHPSWGWQRARAPLVSRQVSPAGFSFASKVGEAPESWTFGFDGMRGLRDQASLAATLANNASVERLAAALEAMEWGAKVGVLLGEYNDHIVGGAAGSYGNRVLDILPVRADGPWSLTHQAYDCRHSNDLLIKSIYDVAPITFTEVF